MTHIVDTLIEERATRLMRHPVVWRIVTKSLYPALGYKTGIEMVDAIARMRGLEVFHHMSETLELDVSVRGLEAVPQKGLVVVTPNHPTGIADGVAVFDALKTVRTDLTFFANRDAIRVCPGLADNIIPVEWIETKRTHRKQRETLRATIEAFRRQRLIVIFPSGRLARPSLRGLRERPWQTSAINLAQKYGAHVIPMHIRARNSWLFYLFWLTHDELRDMTIFRELFNKHAASYEIRVGEMFEPKGDPKELTDALARFVAEEMPKDARAFQETVGWAWSSRRRNSSSG